MTSQQQFLTFFEIFSVLRLIKQSLVFSQFVVSLKQSSSLQDKLEQEIFVIFIK